VFQAMKRFFLLMITIVIGVGAGSVAADDEPSPTSTVTLTPVPLILPWPSATPTNTPTLEAAKVEEVTATPTSSPSSPTSTPTLEPTEAVTEAATATPVVIVVTASLEPTEPTEAATATPTPAEVEAIIEVRDQEPMQQIQAEGEPEAATVYLVDLPSGGQAVVTMSVTAGDIFVVIGLAGLGAVVLWGHIKDLSWLNAKR
jgi:hypothetical protein